MQRNQFLFKVGFDFLPEFVDGMLVHVARNKVSAPARKLALRKRPLQLCESHEQRPRRAMTIVVGVARHRATSPPLSPLPRTARTRCMHAHARARAWNSARGNAQRFFYARVSLSLLFFPSRPPDGCDECALEQQSGGGERKRRMGKVGANRHLANRHRTNRLLEREERDFVQQYMAYEGHGNPNAHIPSLDFENVQSLLLIARSNAPVWLCGDDDCVKSANAILATPGTTDPTDVFAHVPTIELLGCAYNSFGDEEASTVERARLPLTIAAAVRISFQMPRSICIAKAQIQHMVFLPPSWDPKDWVVASEVAETSDTNSALGGLVFRCKKDWLDERNEQLHKRRHAEHGLDRCNLLGTTNSMWYEGRMSYMSLTEQDLAIFDDLPAQFDKDNTELRGPEIVANYGLRLSKEGFQVFGTKQKVAQVSSWTSVKSRWSSILKKHNELALSGASDADCKTAKGIDELAKVALKGIAKKPLQQQQQQARDPDGIFPKREKRAVIRPSGVARHSFCWGRQTLSYSCGVTSETANGRFTWGLYADAGKDGGVQLGMRNFDVNMDCHTQKLRKLVDDVYELHLKRIEAFEAMIQSREDAATARRLEAREEQKRQKAARAALKAESVALASLSKKVVADAVLQAIEAVLCAARIENAQRIVALRALNAGVKARAQARYDARERVERQRASAALNEARAARRGRR